MGFHGIIILAELTTCGISFQKYSKTASTIFINSSNSERALNHCISITLAGW